MPTEDLEKLYRGWINARLWSEDPRNWNEYKHIIRTVTLKNNIKVSDEEIFSELSALMPFNAKSLLEDNYNLINTTLGGSIFKKSSKKEVFHNKQAIDVLNEYIPIIENLN